MRSAHRAGKGSLGHPVTPPFASKAWGFPLFLLNDEQWENFMAALDAPPQPMPRLEKLLREPSVLEKAATP